MNDVAICPICNGKLRKNYTYWSCNYCNRHWSLDAFINKEVLDVDIKDFDIRVYKELLYNGHSVKANEMLREYHARLKEQRKTARRKMANGRANDYKEKMRSLGLCFWCGKNHVHKAGMCFSCYEKKQEYEKERQKKKRRNEKMNEQKTKVETGIAQEVAFRPSRKEDIPETQVNNSSVFTKQATREMLIMMVGDVLKIPIGDYVEEPHVKVTKKRYAYACRESAKKLEGSYKVYERGKDVYVERTA